MTLNRYLRRILYFCCWAIILICPAIIVSCTHKDDTEDDKKADRVVVVYMVAENSLAGQMFDRSDITEMLSGASMIPRGDHLIVYHDGYDLPKLYDITRETKITSFQDLEPVKEWYTDFNSASAETLDEVLQYVCNKYPAESYGLVMWSHGSGWIYYDGSPVYAKAPKTAFGIDTGKGSSSNIGDKMNIDDMARTLSNFKNLDYIMFDACFMQEVEVAYELRNVTSYVIGSPAEIPGEGAPYKYIMTSLFNTKGNPSDIALAYYNYYESRSYMSGVVLSTVKTDQLEPFAALMQELLAKYDFTGIDTHGLLNYFEYDYYRNRQEMPDLFDLKGVMQLVLTPDDYNRWLVALDNLIVETYASDSWYTEFGQTYRTVNHEQCGGITMYIPFDKYRGENFDRQYSRTAWAQRVAQHSSTE